MVRPSILKVRETKERKRLAKDRLWRIGRIGIRRDRRNTNFIRSYKGQEVMETHNHPHPEGTWKRRRFLFPL